MNQTLQDILSQAREVALVIDGVCLPLKFTAPMDPVPSDTLWRTDTKMFKPSGQVWTLQFDAQRHHLRNSVGLHYIHRLLQRPGQFVHASTLITMINGEAVDGLSDNEVFDGGGNGGLVVATELRDAVLPPDALRRLMEAVEDLHGEIEALRANGETEETLMKEEELEKIQTLLRRHTFHNHSESFANAADRARKSVTVAIRRARHAIAQVNPTLDNHLRASIKTGYACCYQPERETHWDL